MSTPTFSGVLAVLDSIRQKIEAEITAIEAKSPDAVKATEEQIIAIVEGAMNQANILAVADAAKADLLQLVQTGSGPIGGPDASLA